MKYRIPFIKPSFPPANDLAEDYAQIVSSNWFTNFGPYEQKLRQQIANYVGEGVSVCAVSNATAGLEVAIRQLFAPPTAAKREVIMPSFTFAAGLDAILAQGYTPVLIDVNDNWQPDHIQAASYLAKYHKKVSGILLGNTFGVGNPNVEDWEALAKEHLLPLLIDSAAGFGSLYSDGTRVGAKGDCEVFSFHATKPFAIGEGGAITSRNASLISRCIEATNFGFNADRKASQIGTNAKMSEMSAAIGLRQMQGYDKRLALRRKSLLYYKNRLSGKNVKFQPNDENSTVPFVCVVFPTERQAKHVMNRLLHEGVEVKRYYDPLHCQPIFEYSHGKKLDLGRTEILAKRIIAMPLHDHMTDETINAIVELMDEGK